MIQKFAEKRTSRQTRILQEKLLEERAVSALATQIMNHATVEEVLEDLTKNSVTQLQLDHCHLYWVDPARQLLIPKAINFLKNSRNYNSLPAIEIKLGEGIVGKVAQNGHGEIISDITSDLRHYIVADQDGSAIVVPIMDGEKVWGVICGVHAQENFFQPRHLHLLAALAAVGAQKIKYIEKATALPLREFSLEENLKKMAEAQLLALRLQLSPHFIFNSLNSINNFILHNETEQASGFLTKFSRLMRQAMVNAKSEWVTLRSELKALQLYLDLEQMRCNGQLQIRLAVNDKLPLDKWQVPSLITYPFVENAIWHGLLPLKDRSPQLTIICEESAGNLMIQIEDNGVGRPPAKFTTSHATTLTAHKSHGIKITEKRLQLVNTLFPVEARLQIVDLIHPDGTPAGTRVTFILKK